MQASFLRWYLLQYSYMISYQCIKLAGGCFVIHAFVGRFKVTNQQIQLLLPGLFSHQPVLVNAL